MDTKSQKAINIKCAPNRGISKYTSASLVVAAVCALALVLSVSSTSLLIQAYNFGFLDDNNIASNLNSRLAYQTQDRANDDLVDADSNWIAEPRAHDGYGDDNENLIDQGEEADQEFSSLGSWSPSGQKVPLNSVSISGSGEIYLLEDKDYPKSLFEDYPRRVGQVSGITTLPNNDVVIFHRAGRHWDEKTFNGTDRRRIAEDQQENLIRNNTIMIIDSEDGSSMASFGSDLFYMPHSVASDHLGNLWVSDVARHQVMRLPAMNIREITSQAKTNSSARHQVWPDIILGEAFVPGSDAKHFCQPSEIAISADAKFVYVADGYCNRRIMVFSGSSGKFLKSFGQNDKLQVVHSLTLIEERNLLCVADREGARVLCYSAGLDGDLARMGQVINQVAHPLGRVFAVTSISPDHLLVSSNQFDSNRYDLSILNPFTHELKLVWVSSDLLEPHSLTTTRDREYVYAADVSKDAYKKVFKFDVIKRET